MTPLNSMYNIIKNHLSIHNKPHFCNLLFSFIENWELIPLLSSSLQNIHMGNRSDFETDVKFYILATDSAANIMSTETFLKNPANKTAFVNRDFSESTIPKKDVKNHIINGTKDHDIPKVWKNQYELNSDSKLEYCINLAWILQYHYVVFSKKKLIPNAITIEYNENYTEYFSLPQSATNEISVKTGLNVRTFLDIAKLLHSSIREQISYNLRLGLYTIPDTTTATSDVDYDSLFDIDKKKAKYKSIKQQDFYNLYVDAYGKKKIDRYNALLRYADTNAYCAYELGTIYYYGDTFYNVNNPYEIKENKELAAKYYRKCITKDFIVPQGAWSLGYMVLEGECNIPEEDRVKIARKIFECCGKFGPAKNSLAKIEFKFAREDFAKYIDLYNNHPKDNSALQEYRTSAVEHYINALNLAKEGTDCGWVYSYNLIYDILSSDAVAHLYDYISSHPRYITLDRIEMIKTAAQLKSSWAMDKLAWEILNKENVTDEDRHEAHVLLVEAAMQNSSKAITHLREYF